jgi:Voltage-dependent anion channel
VGAAIMGTGIVSVALLLDGQGAASAALLWIGLALAAAFAARGLALVATPAGRERLRAAATRPDALTAIAGPCVVASRLAAGGHRWPAVPVLAAAVVAWAALVPRVAGALPSRVSGDAFLLAVATQSPAVLAAGLGPLWLTGAALAAALAGLVLYAAVLARFDPRTLVRGRGAHWVAGGALAIGTLAVARVAQAEGWAHGAGRVAVAALWLAAMAWFVPLVAAELRWPRLAPDPRRWATVFPLGMYAAMSFAVSGVTGWAAPLAFARVETWVAAAAWAALAVAGAAHTVRGGPTSPR